MKNSERIKEILVNLAIEDKLPLDMTELDSSLFEFADVQPEYSIEDIMAHLEDDLVDEDKAKCIQDILEYKSDCNLTFWENIDMAYDRYKGES